MSNNQRAPRVLTLENKFDLFCAAAHTSVKHLNIKAPELHIFTSTHTKHINQRTALTRTGARLSPPLTSGSPLTESNDRMTINKNIDSD